MSAVAFHLPLAGRRRSALALTAALSLLIAVGSFTAAARGATPSKPLTQAQKLAKALKACKKQPVKKRAACVKAAKKKYATHHAVVSLPSAATTPTASTTAPKPPLNSAPAVPVTPAGPVTPPSGPVAPAAITVAELLRLKCFFSAACVVAEQTFQNLTIGERGVPRLGTGTRGDNIRETTWIFPVLVSFDETETALGRGACSTESDPFCEPYVLDRHFEERLDTEYDAGGTWHEGVSKAGTVTCIPSPAERPELVACPRTWGGGV